MTDHPPTTPSTPPNDQDPSGAPNQKGAIDGYHKVAETVGMVPSLRWKDNLLQAVVVVVLGIVGAIIGLIIWGVPGALGMGIGSVITGTLISGIVLMVLGWIRTAKG
jgi:hypothetical protein